MKGVVFVLLMTYGGAVAALFRPFYGLLIYMCFAILRPEQLWKWSLPNEGNYSKIVAIALLIGWAIHGFGNWSFGAAKLVFMFLVGLWLTILASAAGASNQEIAWQYVLLHSKILLPVLVGMTIVNTLAEIRMLAWTLIACLGFLAYEAHGMYYGGNLALFREVGMLGMDNNSICIAMATGAGLALIMGFSTTSWPQKIVAFGLAVVMVHVPMFGHSRGGMLGVVVVGATAFLVLPKRPAVITVYAAGVLVALRLAGPAVLERFSTIFADYQERDASSQSRLDLWADCWEVMTQHPLLGVGPDHWPLVAEQYGWPAGKEAHSLWLNCGAELGFIGLFLLLSLYTSSIFFSWRTLCRRTDVPEPCREIGRMAITALSGFMVSASFVSLDALELPFYVVLLSVASIKLAARVRLAEQQQLQREMPESKDEYAPSELAYSRGIQMSPPR